VSVFLQQDVDAVRLALHMPVQYLEQGSRRCRLGDLGGRRRRGALPADASRGWLQETQQVEWRVGFRQRLGRQFDPELPAHALHQLDLGKAVQPQLALERAVARHGICLPRMVFAGELLDDPQQLCDGRRRAGVVHVGPDKAVWPTLGLSRVRALSYIRLAPRTILG
jgi:hypothetical protein